MGCQRFKAEKHAVDLVKYVNPLQGTLSDYNLSHGNTYPAISMPFGMNCWTPQTGKIHSGWLYSYNDGKIWGFRQTHQPSPWINDYGCFSIMPFAGKIVRSEDERASSFSHERETAFPHYYKVWLDDYSILTEMTPTERSVFFRITFPASDTAGIVIDAFDGGSYIKIIPEKRKIVGYATYNNGGVPENFANYFVIELDRDFYLITMADNDSLRDKNSELYGRHITAVIGFRTRKGEKVHLKASSSFISLLQAENNLNREIGKKTFEEIKASGFEKWNNELQKIMVEGGTEKQKATFYSCLYRMLLFPRMFYEYNTENKPIYYSPYDGKIHQGYMMTDNGFWDTFRAAHPFYTIMYPDITEKQLQSIVNAIEQGGWMPQWSSPGYRNVMAGHHSCSIIADAWIKGIRGFNISKAYLAMIKERNEKAPFRALGRDGFRDYNERGYLPYPEYSEAVSKTLDYAYDDFCIFQLARSLGKRGDLELLRNHAMNYKNVFDTITGFMRGKTSEGQWIEPFNPFEWGGPYTEGNAWHYTWSVFHDIQGLINLMGGKEKFTNKLDALFNASDSVNPGTYKTIIHEMTEMVQAGMGQYAHCNQPVQHVAYLYNYAGQAWKTQYLVRYIMDSLYSALPDGFCGDEDNGQTSAWYVFSALGFYPVTPGNPAYVLGSPLFNRITLKLPGGEKFVIKAQNNTAANIYIQQVKLNNENWNKTWIPHDIFLKGGTLEFDMGGMPEKNWGSSPESVPYSLSAE
jgi:predicted alpha-1,2-mannosidase